MVWMRCIGDKIVHVAPLLKFNVTCFTLKPWSYAPYVVPFLTLCVRVLCHTVLNFYAM
jgi:hypothetical protein